MSASVKQNKIELNVKYYIDSCNSKWSAAIYWVKLKLPTHTHLFYNLLGNGMDKSKTR